MTISFLIVTKGRPTELQLTLNRLHSIVDIKRHEVLVFIDGCSATEMLISSYSWVKWEVSKKSISASPARKTLYHKAVGTILIGLDDDAHPVSSNFISSIELTFEQQRNIGIIAFQEIKGIYSSDSQALIAAKNEDAYETNEFVGCGFAISNKVYRQTKGFPVWIDIYGEESALAMEVMDLGYEIQYMPQFIVNHRVDREKRKLQGKNYFRFERQLRNAFRLYLVYYPNPIKILSKLLWHNFNKYALSDSIYFKLYWKAVANMLFNFFYILKFRKPIQKGTLVKMRSLKNIPY